MPTTRMLLSIGLLLTVSATVAARFPHLGLALAMATGRIDGRPIAIADFVPATFAGPTTTMRCASLLFELPEQALAEPSPGEDAGILWLRFNGASCHVFPPLREIDVMDEWLADADWASPYANDEISLRTALYKSTGDDLSFWMSSQEAQSLHQRLALRAAVSPAADRIEVLRGETLSGFLLFYSIDGAPYLQFDYFSNNDRSLRGRVFITPDPGQTMALEQIRAFLGSLRLDDPTMSGRPT